jgi:hypothetical protein
MIGKDYDDGRGYGKSKKEQDFQRRMTHILGEDSEEDRKEHERQDLEQEILRE